MTMRLAALLLVVLSGLSRKLTSFRRCFAPTSSINCAASHRQSRRLLPLRRGVRAWSVAATSMVMAAVAAVHRHQSFG